MNTPFSHNSYSIRAGAPQDFSGIELLLPRLADFDTPGYRTPEHLWQGDRDLILAWAQGHRNDIDIVVAVSSDAIIGISALSLRKELLSGEPSAHLEVLAIDAESEGMGVGSALMRESELIALSRGAKSMSLHVFAENRRARSLYERHGYHGELMRYFKPLT